MPELPFCHTRPDRGGRAGMAAAVAGYNAFYEVSIPERVTARLGNASSIRPLGRSPAGSPLSATASPASSVTVLPREHLDRFAGLLTWKTWFGRAGISRPRRGRLLGWAM